MIDDMAVYIANLGKYNEGCLVGAWFTFPIDEEDVKEKIGSNEQVAATSYCQQTTYQNKERYNLFHIGGKKG